MDQYTVGAMGLKILLNINTKIALLSNLGEFCQVLSFLASKLWHI